jgi:hypothetical protein
MTILAVATKIHHRRPSMAYTDPPWNAGNARAFRTKANAETPSIKTRPVDFERLLEYAFQALAMVEGAVFVEMGNRSTDITANIAQVYGLDLIDYWPITYYGSKPCSLLLFREMVPSDRSWMPVTNLFMEEDMEPTPAGMDEPAEWCIRAASAEGDLVFDPFLGQGLVAVSAAKNDRLVCGCELNPRRLAVALDKLSKLIDEQPRRII